MRARAALLSHRVCLFFFRAPFSHLKAHDLALLGGPQRANQGFDCVRVCVCVCVCVRIVDVRGKGTRARAHARNSTTPFQKNKKKGTRTDVRGLLEQDAKGDGDGAVGGWGAQPGDGVHQEGDFGVDVQHGGRCLRVGCVKESAGGGGSARPCCCFFLSLSPLP